MEGAVHAGRMASKPEAPGPPASSRRIRFEINLRGKDHVIETNLDLLRGRTASHRKGEDMVWDFGGVRAIVDEEGAEIFVTDNLSVMDAERRWRIVEAQLEDLERLGFLLRKRR